MNGNRNQNTKVNQEEPHGQSRKSEKHRLFWYLAGGSISLALVAGLLAAGFFVWQQYRDSIIQNQRAQLLVTVQAAADSLARELASYADDACLLAETAYTDDGRIDTAQFRAYLKARQFADNLIVRGKNGQVLWQAKPATFKATYAEAVYKTRGVVFSAAASETGDLKLRFRHDAGFHTEKSDTKDETSDNSIAASKNLNTASEPLSKQKTNEQITSIEVIADAASFYETLSGIRIGKEGYFILKSADSILLMHPEKRQIGKHVIEGRYALYPGKKLDLKSLSAMIAEQETGKSGTSIYDSYWWTNPNLPRVRKLAAYAPVPVGDSFLILSADLDYSEVYEPVRRGFSGIVLVFVCILLVILLFLCLLLLMARRARQGSEEIRYLRSLNEVLEETQKSRESLAHHQRLQIMGTMTGGIAHEFNNLLTPIMGYADLLMAELPPSSDAWDSAQEILDAAEKAKEIVRQISSLSRKNMETAFSWIEAKPYLVRCMKMVQSICPANIQLQTAFQLSEEGFLGNKTELNQVLLNLCVNAFHAIGDKEGGRLLITAKPAVRGELLADGIADAELSGVWENYLCICVADNGCGMDKATMEQIFTPFFTTKGQGRGTGLGLSIVDQIVRAHSGQITVHSEKGTGSRFCVYIPLAEKAADAGNAVQGAQEGSTPAEALSLLLVEPNAKVVKLLQQDFEQLGVSFYAAESAKEAEQLVSAQTFDAAVISESLGRGGSDTEGIDLAMVFSAKAPSMLRILTVKQIRKEAVEARQRGIIDLCLEEPLSASGIIQGVRTASKARQ